MLATAAKLPDADPIPAKKPRDSVTISDILERRAKAGKLIAGTAAYCDSDMFKAPVSFVNHSQGLSMADYVSLVSWETQGQKMGS